MFFFKCQGCHPLRNLTVYNTVLKAFAEAQEWEKALTMMAEMREMLCLEPPVMLLLS
jgi:pentatricopeptide repeat protein